MCVKPGPLGRATRPPPSSPMPALRDHVSMNENTRLGLSVPRKVRERHTDVHSETAITRAKHMAVQRWDTMTDPWPGGRDDPRTVPVCTVSCFQVPTLSQWTSLRNFKNRDSEEGSSTSSPVPPPTSTSRSRAPGPQGTSPSQAGAGLGVWEKRRPKRKP